MGRGYTPAAGGSLLYRYIGAPSYWQNMPGAAEHVAVAQDNSVWAVQANGDIYHYVANTWTGIPGKARQVSVGYDGTIYALGTTATAGGFTMYRYIGAPNYWQPIPGGAMQIVGAGPNEFWAHQ